MEQNLVMKLGIKFAERAEHAQQWLGVPRSIKTEHPSGVPQVKH